MTDLLRAILARRGTVAADALLDCLALAAALDECRPDAIPQKITLADLRRVLWCRSNMEVIQRMAALEREGLVEATYHSGRNAYWEVHSVGPVA